MTDSCSSRAQKPIGLAALFRLKAPCGNCPFLRKGAIDLRPGRLEEIAEGLIRDDYSTFTCHKTLPSQIGKHGAEAHCAGALIYLHKAKRPNVWMRLAAIGGADPMKRLLRSFDLVIEPLKLKPKPTARRSNCAR